MGVRLITRQAFEAFRTAGEAPSIRKVYGAVGGSYDVVASEVKALWQELMATEPAPLELSAPLEPVVMPPEAEPLVTRTASGALPQLLAALRADRRAYHNLVLFARQVQDSRTGPLTDFLRDLTGLVDGE